MPASPILSNTTWEILHFKVRNAPKFITFLYKHDTGSVKFHNWPPDRQQSECKWTKNTVHSACVYRYVYICMTTWTPCQLFNYLYIKYSKSQNPKHCSPIKEKTLRSYSIYTSYPMVDLMSSELTPVQMMMSLKVPEAGKENLTSLT